MGRPPKKNDTPNVTGGGKFTGHPDSSFSSDRRSRGPTMKLPPVIVVDNSQFCCVTWLLDNSVSRPFDWILSPLSTTFPPHSAKLAQPRASHLYQLSRCCRLWGCLKNAAAHLSVSRNRLHSAFGASFGCDFLLESNKSRVSDRVTYLYPETLSKKRSPVQCAQF